MDQLNRVLARYMPFLTPASVLAGFLLANFLHHGEALVPWIFACMTFAGSLSANFTSLLHAVKRPGPMLLAFVVLHFIMPLVALGLGHLFFPGDVNTITGLVLLTAIPTGITAFVWVAMQRGDIGLTLSTILLGTLLSPMLVPLILHLLVGGDVQLEILPMMEGLLWMIVLPSIAGMLVNQLCSKSITSTLSKNLAPFSKIGLIAVVSINASVVAPHLQGMDMTVIGIVLLVFCLSFTGYLLSWLLGKLFRYDRTEIVSVTFIGGMRNISAGVVLAVSFFPAPVAIPVVIGMLFQQVLAAVFSSLLKKYEPKQAAA
ncbi:bile acid:sodium symporter family protein [Terribacillus saccharophilus]|uniref:bile acid:sodium symporter family protein n=1 Tax=Terribacillus saccharophilus TaxID=361277 RepID=UPI002DD2813D|nr:bile acid:sodium symporter family protein [Terribacillus saccharophilus]